MGYVKLDDAFLDHPKFLEAGPLAGYLALCAIAWANRNRTDGYIPAAQVRRLAVFDDVYYGQADAEDGYEVDVRTLTQRLLDVGLWEKTTDGAYYIHDYLDWQQSADEIRALSTARADAGRKGAIARWTGAARADTDSNNDGNTDSPEMATSQQPYGKDHGNGDGNSKANGCQKEEVRSKELQTASSSELDHARFVRGLFEHWQQRCNHPQAKLTRDRAAKVKARLREGYTVEQIRQAIDGAARAPYISPDGKKYDDLELICRSGSKLEGFIDRAATNGVGNGAVNDKAVHEALARNAALARGETL